MTRYYWDKKQEADELLKLDLAWLRQQGLLSGSYTNRLITWTSNQGYKNSINFEVLLDSENQVVNLSYTQRDVETDQKIEFKYPVRLTTTSCNLGGARYWFICPLSVAGKSCNRRVRTLYKGGNYFGCRHCFNLSYSSQNINRRYQFFDFYVDRKNEDKFEKLVSCKLRKSYRGKITKRWKKLLILGAEN